MTASVLNNYSNNMVIITFRVYCTGEKFASKSLFHMKCLTNIKIWFPPAHAPASFPISKWVMFILETNILNVYKNPKILKVRLEEPFAFSGKFSLF